MWSQGLTKETDVRLKKVSEARKRYKMSETTKQKIRSSRIGKIPPNKGKPMSFEQKIKCRNAKLLRPVRYWKGKKRDNLRGKNNVVCLACGSGFHMKLSKLNKTMNVFCSRRCYESYRIKHPEVQPNWKGGKIETGWRGTEWTKIRHVVLLRDNFVCQECKCAAKKPIVHHVVPFRVSQDNSISNLMVLCSKCHGKKEREAWLNAR